MSFPVLRPDPETLPAGLELEEVGWQPYPEEDIELVALHYRYPARTMDLHIQQIALGEKWLELPRPAAHATFHPSKPQHVSPQHRSSQHRCSQRVCDPRPVAHATLHTPQLQA